MGDEHRHVTAEWFVYISVPKNYYYSALHCICVEFHHYIVTALLLFVKPELSRAMGSIGEASVEFCVDVFKELKDQHVNNNIVFSPLMIISALSMVNIGAREDTRAQIDKVRLQ